MHGAAAQSGTHRHGPQHSRQPCIFCGRQMRRQQRASALCASLYTTSACIDGACPALRLEVGG